MINVTVLSRLFMEKYKSNEPYIVISYRCPGDSLPKFSYDPNRKDILYIEINDVDDTELFEEYKILNEEEAEQIIDFVTNHEDISNIVVHCDAGVSRSSGTAAALLKIFNGDDSEIFDNKKFIPNMYIYNLIINKAFEKEYL